MTRTTHQVGAFAAAIGSLALARPLFVGQQAGLPQHLPDVLGRLGLAAAGRLPWLVVAAYLLLALIGGIAPDLDKPRRLWTRLLAGKLLGGHRHLSHSLLGTALAGAILGVVLAALAPLLSFPPGVPWLGFMSGYLSHLLLDSLTYEGVPWLYPARATFAFPPRPLSRLRIRTGEWSQEYLATPALPAFIGWLGYSQGEALASLWR